MEFSTQRGMQARRVAKIAELMAEEMREKLGEGAQVAEIEQALRELAKEVSGLGLQKAIEECEEKYPNRVACRCGQEAQPAGQRKAVVWTVFASPGVLSRGKVSYRRRYYVCPNCHRGQ